MNETSLVFPKGEFTHTELALANGKTNQQVWVAYQKAIKDGIIVTAGVRPNTSGKGKPSKIWKVADGQPVPLVEKVVVAEVVKTKIVSSLLPVSKSIVELIAKVDELPEIKPATPPVAQVVEVVKVEPKPEIVVVENIARQATETEHLCPFCQTKLLAIGVPSGVKVWCPVNDPKICSCSENPYGVSNTVKNAVEILHDKFFKHRTVKA